MADITWTNEKRTLSQLIPWPRNPRLIKNASAKRLQQSFVKFGQPETIQIGPDDSVYNGHQRLKSWLTEFGDVEVDVRVSSRPLTEKEREKLTVYLHKGATGEFDFDILANEFELDDLLEWGFEPFEFGLEDEGIGAQRLSAEEIGLDDQFGVFVECSTEKEQNELLERLLTEGYNCKALVS